MTLSAKHQAMLDLLQKHVQAEIDGDIDTTMSTMSDKPHLHNIAVMMGGTDYDSVKEFYVKYLVGKFFPPDIQMNLISRTIDDYQIVEELVLTFTHTTAMEWMLPNVAPTGKKVEIGLVVIVKFEDGKIAHEHIFWDQASLLVQVGLLNPKGLPVVGGESARHLLDLHSKSGEKK